MGKFEKYLFFYSIFAITIIAISLAVFEPKPINLIVTIALVPIVFYFWTRMTSPQAVSAEKWSLRMLSVIVVLGSMGIFGYSLSKKYPKPDLSINEALNAAKIENDELRQKINALNAEVNHLRNLTKPLTSSPSTETVADIIKSTPKATNLQQITGKSGVKMIDVRENPISASKIITTLEPKTKYIYIEKQNNWYKVALSDSGIGWVSASQVVEVQ